MSFELLGRAALYLGHYSVALSGFYDDIQPRRTLRWPRHRTITHRVLRSVLLGQLTSDDRQVVVRDALQLLDSRKVRKPAAVPRQVTRPPRSVAGDGLPEATGHSAGNLFDGGCGLHSPRAHQGRPPTERPIRAHPPDVKHRTTSRLHERAPTARRFWKLSCVATTRTAASGARDAKRRFGISPVD